MFLDFFKECKDFLSNLELQSMDLYIEACLTELPVRIEGCWKPYVYRIAQPILSCSGKHHQNQHLPQIYMNCEVIEHILSKHIYVEPSSRKISNVHFSITIPFEDSRFQMWSQNQLQFIYNLTKTWLSFRIHDLNF